ncbi:MAG: glucokinase [Candidatus Latescibacterota bacterium]|jgi:glucokinase
MGGTIIIAGDVGGTKTYLAAYQPTEHAFKPLAEKRYTTCDFADIGALIAAFVEESGYQPQRVVLGVPGPVRQLPVRAVNLPWLIDPEQIKSHLGIDEVYLLNDLQATSYGTLVLEEDDLCILNEGESDNEGNIAVIAAGTGLGEGGLVWAGTHYISVASEGGHSTYAPGSDLEAELWRYLNRKFDHVSWERVTAGPGLASIYDFLCERDPKREPAWLRDELAQGDRSNTISSAALEEKAELAVEAMDLYVHLYGCEAGNLALKFMATGGLFIGGGIAPKILTHLQNGRFLQGFFDKGRMGEVLQLIPVKVVLNDKTGLLGAAYWGSLH